MNKLENLHTKLTEVDAKYTAKYKEHHEYAQRYIALVASNAPESEIEMARERSVILYGEWLDLVRTVQMLRKQIVETILRGGV